MTVKEWMSEFIATQPQERVARLVGLVLSDLLDLQTASEQASDATTARNSVGFTGADGRSGSKCAKSFRKRGTLVGWQIEQWTRPSGKAGLPRLCKYHGQIDLESVIARLEKEQETMANDIESLRKEYARIRGLFVTASDVSQSEFDALVRNVAGVSPSPSEWVAVAKSMEVNCCRCAGTGQYVTMVLNGKPTGPGGICFRCEGKGYQNEADARRNWGYDRYDLNRRAQ